MLSFSVFFCCFAILHNWIFSKNRNYSTAFNKGIFDEISVFFLTFNVKDWAVKNSHKNSSESVMYSVLFILGGKIIQQVQICQLFEFFKNFQHFRCDLLIFERNVKCMQINWFDVCYSRLYFGVCQQIF